MDNEIQKVLASELKRQQHGIELIPSENFVSQAVLSALGSVATNKYAEGYPGRRYYGGTEYMDDIENLAISRAQKLFSAEHVNVQPHSGAPANMAAYAAVLEPGDTVLGMDLSHGGHLTHGHPVTFPAKIYNFIRYKTTSDGLIDYDNLEQLAREHKPKLILVGYSAYSREIDYNRIKAIADKSGAITMADIAHIAGLIAGGVMNNPVPFFDIVTTTTHKTLRGPRGGMIMCKKSFAKKIDKAVFPHLQGGPHMNNIAAKAVAFAEALEPSFKTYAQNILDNAQAMAHVFTQRNFTICFGGTENHLMLVDLTNKGVSGKEAQERLDAVGITLNMNMIPDDPRSPMDPSGIRLGTPAITTRGFKPEDCAQIAEILCDILEDNSDAKAKNARKIISDLTTTYPLY